MLTGCTSYRTIDLHKDAGQVTSSYQTIPALSQGDQIKYTLKDGRKGEMVYQSTNSNIINGQGNDKISLEQVDKLERKEFSKGKTAAAGGVGVAVVTVAVIAIAVSGMTTALIAAL